MLEIFVLIFFIRSPLKLNKADDIFLANNEAVMSDTVIKIVNCVAIKSNKCYLTTHFH